MKGVRQTFGVRSAAGDVSRANALNALLPSLVASVGKPRGTKDGEVKVAFCPRCLGPKGKDAKLCRPCSYRRMKAGRKAGRTMSSRDDGRSPIDRDPRIGDRAA